MQVNIAICTYYPFACIASVNEQYLVKYSIPYNVSPNLIISEVFSFIAD